MSSRLRGGARSAALVLMLLGVLWTVAGPASAAESTNYGIRPAGSADHFRLELAPGAASKQTAIVSNRSGKKITFKIYPAEAITTEQGGFGLRSRDEPQSGVGVWARLPIDTVTISPGSQKRVAFRVSVPATTTPGDYAGGIILEAPPRRGTPGEVGDQTAVQLNVVERVGVRVYLKVSGTARAELTPGPLSVKNKDQAIAFSMPVTNTGNVILAPVVNATVRGPLGGGKQLKFTEVPELLPGETITVRTTWQRPPRLIWGDAEATVKYAGGTELVRAEVRRIPIVPGAIATAVTLLVLWLAARAIRTVQRARRVLRQQHTIPGPLVPPAQRGPAAPTRTAPKQLQAQGRGRHRA